MVEVKLNKGNDNPFYGLRNCLTLFQSVGRDISSSLLDACWNEVKDSKEKKQMFFSLLFSIGDITARQHNIFKGTKRDSGGNANREGFIQVLDWMWAKDKSQFIKFLNAGLFNEYTCFDLLLRNRVQTKGKQVTRVHNVLGVNEYRVAIADYLYKVINGNNPFDKLLVAKFLTLPRLSKRSGHKQMLAQTRKVMEDKVKLLQYLSELCGWEYEVKPNYANFKGYRNWRKEYNGSLESVLFSTGKIREFDEQGFIKWLDQLPAQARFRVKNRVLYSKKKVIHNGVECEVPKYSGLQVWYKTWEEYKEKKQAEQRVLEEKVRQGQASEEDKVKLEKVKKEAKVTVGATNFNELYEQICKNQFDKLKLESFINKVNLPYNSLVIIDDSGSMQGAPFNFGVFLAAVCLYKNPDDDARNLIGMFNYGSSWYSHIDQQASSTPNSIMRRSATKVAKTPFVDPHKSFFENYQRIASFCAAAYGWGGSTNISSIPEGLHEKCKANPEMLDVIRNYPVWTIVSDGEWNNLSSPEASINDFFRKCEKYFGFRPFIIAIDVANRWVNANTLASRAERFSGIDNLMYIPSNPALIEQFLTNFKDMDVFDVYTPLQSIYRSNRYDIVRENVL